MISRLDLIDMCALLVDAPRCRKLLVALAALLAPRESSCWDAWDRADVDLSGPGPWGNLIGEGWRAEEVSKAPPATPSTPPVPPPPPPRPGLAALSCNYSDWEPVPSPWPGWSDARVCTL